MPPVTVQQVAEAAGVSRSTANKVLLGEAALFREQTAKKVMDAAQSLGYRPNMVARGLRARRTFLVGTLLSSVNAPWAYELYAGIQEVAAEHDCAPITFSCPDRAHETRSIQLCLDRQVDALLVNTAPTTSTPENHRLLIQEAKNGLPMVELFGRNLTGVPSIVSDYHAGGYQATLKLIESGLKNNVYWSPFPFDDDSKPTPSDWFALEMYQGYRQAMREAGLPHTIAHFDMPKTRQEAQTQLVEQARRLLADRPGLHAVVSPGDFASNAVSRAIIDDPALAGPGFTQASFHTGHKPMGLRDRRLQLRIRAREIGEAAARMAFEQISGGKPDSQSLAPDLDFDRDGR